MIKSIVKYNVQRQYFGNWTSKELRDSFRSCMNQDRPKRVWISTGVLSLESICNTLWNEMSYNPLRFGTESPFVIVNGKLDRKKAMDFYLKGTPESQVMKNVLQCLDAFIDSLGKYDTKFRDTGISACTSVDVGCEEYTNNSNDGYKILSTLVHCIHIICSQNNKDAGCSKYRNEMLKIIQQRHPNMQRSMLRKIFVSIPCLVKPDNAEENIDDEKKREQQKIIDGIQHAIRKKETERCYLEMQRDNLLNDLEQPGDVSEIEASIKKIGAEIHKMECVISNIDRGR